MWNEGWDNLFARKKWGSYPSEDLVRYMLRKFPNEETRKSTRVLEIGCGTGANLSFLAGEGFLVSGIDGSKVALEHAIRLLNKKKYSCELINGDASNLPWQDAHFDVIVDIECIYSNSFSESKKIIAECKRVMKRPGSLFSKCFATGTTGEGSGQRIENEVNTWRDIAEGPFNKGYGIVRFTSELDIFDLYNGFDELSWDYVSRSDWNRKIISKEWLISGEYHAIK